MSVAPKEITCDRCSMRWSETSTWGSFYYLINRTEKVRMDRTWGWCDHCNSFEPIEVLPDPERIRSAIERKKKNGNDNDTGYYSLLSIEELESLLDWRLNRISPPRCLKCAKFDVRYLDLSLGDSSARVIDDFPHPGCGGRLVLQLADYRLSIRLRERLFAPEGRRIEKSGQWF